MFALMICAANPLIKRQFCFVGYGFVDFDVPVAAEAAVKALQAQGIQAQMAKVSILRNACTFCFGLKNYPARIAYSREFLLVHIPFAEMTFRVVSHLVL